MAEQEFLAADQSAEAFAALEQEHSELEDRFARLIDAIQSAGLEFTDEMRAAIEGEIEEEPEDEEVEDFFVELQQLFPSQRFDLCQRIIAQTSAILLTDIVPSFEDGKSDDDDDSLNGNLIDLATTIGADLARLDAAAQQLAEVQSLSLCDELEKREDESEGEG